MEKMLFEEFFSCLEITIDRVWNGIPSDSLVLYSLVGKNGHGNALEFCFSFFVFLFVFESFFLLSFLFFFLFLISSLFSLIGRKFLKRNTFLLFLSLEGGHVRVHPSSSSSSLLLFLSFSCLSSKSSQILLSFRCLFLLSLQKNVLLLQSSNIKREFKREKIFFLNYFLNSMFFF